MAPREMPPPLHPEIGTLGNRLQVVSTSKRVFVNDGDNLFSVNKLAMCDYFEVLNVYVTDPRTILLA